MMVLAGDSLWLAGSFTSCGGKPRTAVCAIDKVTGAARAFNAQFPPGAIATALFVDGGKVHVGGKFASVAGQPRTNFAALDASTGALLAFAPTFNDWVRAFETDGSRLFVGGDFTTVNDTARNGLATLDPLTGALVSGPRDVYKSQPGGYLVSAFEGTGDALHVIGDFDSARSGSVRVAQAGLLSLRAP